jgi:thymidylate kinase
LTLAKKEPERFCLIDARQGEDAVFSVIQSDLKRHFSLGGN